MPRHRQTSYHSLPESSIHLGTKGESHRLKYSPSIALESVSPAPRARSPRTICVALRRRGATECECGEHIRRLSRGASEESGWVGLPYYERCRPLRLRCLSCSGAASERPAGHPRGSLALSLFRLERYSGRAHRVSPGARGTLERICTSTRPHRERICRKEDREDADAAACHNVWSPTALTGPGLLLPADPGAQPILALAAQTVVGRAVGCLIAMTTKGAPRCGSSADF